MRWLFVLALIACTHRFDPVEAQEIRAAAIAVGARAPEAKLSSSSGSQVALSSVLAGNAKTVLVFYRGFY